MSKVKYVSSPNEIPAGKKHVLVIYGEEYAQTGHPLGLTITVARTVSQLSFLTAVHTHGVIPGSSHTPALRISSPGIDKAHLMGPCNHGELQWSTMLD